MFLTYLAKHWRVVVDVPDLPDWTLASCRWWFWWWNTWLNTGKLSLMFLTYLAEYWRVVVDDPDGDVPDWILASCRRWSWLTWLNTGELSLMFLTYLTEYWRVVVDDPDLPDWILASCRWWSWLTWLNTGELSLMFLMVTYTVAVLFSRGVPLSHTWAVKNDDSIDSKSIRLLMLTTPKNFKKIILTNVKMKNTGTLHCWQQQLITCLKSVHFVIFMES
jgi:hypothetical protein